MTRDEAWKETERAGIQDELDALLTPEFVEYFNEAFREAVMRRLAAGPPVQRDQEGGH
jgi:hypothetical protein